VQCVCFFHHKYEKTDVKLIKKASHVFWSNNYDISVGLPVEINNPVPVSHVRFQQFHVIECLCIEGSNKRSDREALSGDNLNCLLTVLSECQYRNFWLYIFPFNGTRSSGRGGLTSGTV